MKKATKAQIDKLKELQRKSATQNLSEFRAICTHFLQLLKDINFTSQFSSDFSNKLIRFDFNSDKTYISQELRELMKSAIDYHEDNL